MKAREWFAVLSMLSYARAGYLLIWVDRHMSDRAFAPFAAGFIFYMTWWLLDLRARGRGGQ